MFLFELIMCAKVDWDELLEWFTRFVFPNSISLIGSIDPASCFCQAAPSPTASFYFPMSQLFVSLSSLIPLTPFFPPPPSIHQSSHGPVIAANLSQGSLEGFRAGLCSSGLLNAAHGEGERALRGRLDMSSLAATVYQWRQRRYRGKAQADAKRLCTATYGCYISYCRILKCFNIATMEDTVLQTGGEKRFCCACKSVHQQSAVRNDRNTLLVPHIKPRLAYKSHQMQRLWDWTVVSQSDSHTLPVIQSRLQVSRNTCLSASCVCDCWSVYIRYV